ncbi:MAG: glycosyltransferase family 9 protein [Ignavibacteria bacterium]|nr:MAG: glycosyltransferase family 9 protein [Ignavibacteria bacterium]
MAKQTFYSKFTARLIKRLFAVDEIKNFDIPEPKKILVVRQHNQFGDMLASVSLFRAIKEKYPDSHLTVIVSPQNYYAITKNEFIDRYFIFDKKKLLNPYYFIKLLSVLRGNYDLGIVPATVSISYTSSLLLRLSNSAVRVGPASLNGAQNDFSYFFDRRIDLDWRRYPDTHVSDFGQEILRPLGISTNNFRSSISFGEEEKKEVDKFFEQNNIDYSKRIVGLHVGAGKPKNRWSLDKFIKVIESLKEDFDAQFVITGSRSDKNELDYIQKNLNIKVAYFIDRKIPALAALISRCDLFITNDTGVMHVAGATDTPQISIFGPTNPFNWAPVGSNKFFLRKSDLIDDVTVGDVLELARMILSQTVEEGINA